MTARGLGRRRSRAYYDEHDGSASTPTPGDRSCSRSRRRAGVERSGRPSHDPAGDHDWVIEAEVDLDASDEVGEPVVLATALRRLDG